MNRWNKVYLLCKCLYEILFKKDALSLDQCFDLSPIYCILEIADSSLLNVDCNISVIIIFNLRSWIWGIFCELFTGAKYLDYREINFVTNLSE